MRIFCPVCNSKARIAASSQVTSETRYIYGQCRNLNCAATFKGLLHFEVIRSSDVPSLPPDPEIQPELVENPDQSVLEFHESA